jgi:hypothetical protein
MKKTMTDSQTIRVKGTCAITGAKFDRYSVPNVVIKGQPCWVHYVFYYEDGSYTIHTEDLPDIMLLQDGSAYWHARNSVTDEALGASSLKAAFDYAVKHWWTGF